MERKVNVQVIRDPLLRDGKGNVRKCYYNETALIDFVQDNMYCHTSFKGLRDRLGEYCRISLWDEWSDGELSDVVKKYEEAAKAYGVYAPLPEKTMELVYRECEKMGIKVTENAKRNHFMKPDYGHVYQNSPEDCVYGESHGGCFLDRFDEDRHWKIPHHVVKTVIGKPWCESREESERLREYKCYFDVKE